jgi:hypothetical protein
VTVEPLIGILGLLICLSVGVWIGYRYATESRRVDAIIDHTLSRLDAEREYDELRAWQRQEADKWLEWDRQTVPWERRA